MNNRSEALTVALAGAALARILDDQQAGNVPITNGFDELHDHVDANEYMIAAESAVGVDLDPSSDADCAILNAALDRVDSALRRRYAKEEA